MSRARLQYRSSVVLIRKAIPYFVLCAIICFGKSGLAAIEDSLSQIYIVSTKQTLTKSDDINKLESFCKMKAPTGYREYMMRLGDGDFFDMHVCTPAEIMKSPRCEKLFIDKFNEYWRPPQPLTRDDLKSSYEFAYDDNGNFIVACPRFPGKVFLIPHSGDKIEVYPSGFLKPILFFPGAQRKEFAYFSPKREIQRGGFQTKLTSKALVDRIANYWKSSELHKIDEGKIYGKSQNSYSVYVKSLGGYFAITPYDDEPQSRAFLIVQGLGQARAQCQWSIDPEHGQELEQFRASLGADVIKR